MCQFFIPGKAGKKGDKGEKSLPLQVSVDTTCLNSQPVFRFLLSFASGFSLRSCSFPLSLLHTQTLSPSLTVSPGPRQLPYSRQAPYMAASCLSWLASSIPTHATAALLHTITLLRALKSQMRQLQSPTWKCHISYKWGWNKLLYLSCFIS